MIGTALSYFALSRLPVPIRERQAIGGAKSHNRPPFIYAVWERKTVAGADLISRLGMVLGHIFILQNAFKIGVRPLLVKLTQHVAQPHA